MNTKGKGVRADLVVAGVFMALGAYILVASLGLPAGSGGYPGAGFFPTVLGVVMLALSGMLGAQAVLGRSEGGFRADHGWMVTGVTGLTFAYLLFWGSGVFALRTFLFVALLLRFLGQSWKTGLTVSAVLTAATTAAFQMGLNLSLD